MTKMSRIVAPLRISTHQWRDKEPGCNIKAAEFFKVRAKVDKKMKTPFHSKKFCHILKEKNFLNGRQEWVL